MSKVITLRYPAYCSDCGAQLHPGDKAKYYNRFRIYGLTCHTRESSTNGERADYSFRDPGGRSALRAGSRRYPCPTCGQENALSKADVNLGYQCDRCADRAEGLLPWAEY